MLTECNVCVLGRQVLQWRLSYSAERLSEVPTGVQDVRGCLALSFD